MISSVTIVVSASNVRTILAFVTDVSKGIVTWYSPQDKLSLLYVQETGGRSHFSFPLIVTDIRFDLNK